MSRALRLAMVAGCAAAVFLGVGCSLGGGDDKSDSADRSATSTSSSPPAGGRLQGEPREAAVIRAWSRDVSAGQYERAARYFVPRNAIVIQGAPLRLRDRKAVVAFNRSLPCKSKVTDVQRQGRDIVAAFELMPGTGAASSCDAPVRVRFTFKGDRFQVFRQLTDSPAPSGDVT